MKVVLITRDDIGGIGLMCLQLQRALEKIGHECRMVVLQNHTHQKGVYTYGYRRWRITERVTEFLAKHGIADTKRKAAWDIGGKVPTSYINLLHCPWVKWADVVHLHLVAEYVDYPSFCKGIGKPVVWTTHDEYFFHGVIFHEKDKRPDHPLEQYYAEVKRKAYAHIEKMGIVLLSEYQRKKFEGNGLLEGREVRVINNAVDTTMYHPMPRHEARKRLGLNDTDIVFAFTAFDICDDRKGLDTLSEAVMKLGNPRIKIVAIGHNTGNRSWPNVTETGYKEGAEAMSEVLSAADYFAMPSKAEAFALSPMQAMACGLPVVAFPVSGTSELINERNGVICNGFTTEALKDGIETLMGRQYDADAIRQDMMKRFSPETNAREYVSLYKRVRG